jgi:trk system potassium uptake protein TrkH
MRTRPVVGVVGLLLVFVGAAMLLAAAVSLAYREEDLLALLAAAGITVATGLALFLGARLGSEPRELSHRGAFAVVTLGWFGSCLFGALPYFLFAHLPPLLFADAPALADADATAQGASAFGPTISPPDCRSGTGLGREYCSPVNALFESTSGFTTTGATILEAGLWRDPGGRRGGLPHGILFWRALTHFLGGMGIIVLGVAILPLLGVGGMQLFRAEVPGPIKDKMAPRVAETARLLWKVYAGLTVAEFVALWAAGHGPYLAICHAFATMATGGFSPLATSIEGLGSPAAEWIVVLFMLLAGSSFSLHLAALHRRRPEHLFDPEFRLYAAVAVVFAAGIAASLWLSGDFGTHDGLRAGVFQAVSILTTTGFSSRDFAVWGVAAQIPIFLLFFVGGSSGSTGGGIKCLRVLLMFRLATREIRRLVHPHAVIQTKLGGRVVGDDVLHSVAGFLLLYFLIFFLSAAAFGFGGHDLVTSLTAAGATLGNIGPGLGEVGPAGSYNLFADPLKLMCVFTMIAGRLEIYSVLIVFTPALWRR